MKKCRRSRKFPTRKCPPIRKLTIRSIRRPWQNPSKNRVSLTPRVKKNRVKNKGRSKTRRTATRSPSGKTQKPCRLPPRKRTTDKSRLTRASFWNNKRNLITRRPSTSSTKVIRTSLRKTFRKKSKNSNKSLWNSISTQRLSALRKVRRSPVSNCKCPRVFRSVTSRSMPTTSQ